MVGEKLYRNEQILRGMYVDQGLSMRQIGTALGTTAATIKYWLKKFDIDGRDFDIGALYRGKSRTEEDCQNISDKAKERYKDKAQHPMTGKKHTEASKQKMSQTKKRKRQERIDALKLTLGLVND